MIEGSVLTDAICNSGSRPVILAPEGSHTLLVFHPYMNGFYFPLHISTMELYTPPEVRDLVSGSYYIPFYQASVI
jgi:hypothetical protein